ncbi:hypothetical protein SAMN05428981_10985 [Bacillus sp. OV194]|nr:hypothetical protein SAMN05428981_10985 [Bacillus sp. OV194]
MDFSKERSVSVHSGMPGVSGGVFLIAGQVDGFIRGFSLKISQKEFSCCIFSSNCMKELYKGGEIQLQIKKSGKIEEG